MLEIIAVVLVVLWIVGFIGFHILGGFIHILLVVAFVVIVVRFIKGE